MKCFGLGVKRICYTVFVLLIVVCFFFQILSHAIASEGDNHMVHLSSKANLELVSCEGTVYYLENHYSILGHYSELFCCHKEGLTRISRIPYYADFVGVYNGKILMRLTESSYTNYPTSIQYSLFNPSTYELEALPSLIVELFTLNDFVQIRAIDNVLFIIYNDLLFYYSPINDALVPVFETTIDHIGITPTFFFVDSGEKSYYVYSIGGEIKTVKAQSDLPEISIRMPDTHLMYYVDKTIQGFEIHCLNLLNNCDEVVVAGIIIPIDMLILSLDNYGQFLYYRMSDIDNNHIFKRYDLENYNSDDLFIQETVEKEYEYISSLVIQYKEMVSVTHEKNDVRVKITNLIN